MPDPKVDSFLKTQVRIWLGEVLHVRLDEETPIADLLADGELLFQVSKVVWKMLLKKHVELKDSKIFIHERTSFAKSDGKYMPYAKVDSFLQICQIIGLTGIDLFSPSDVVEKRDIRKVCLCIRSLSKKARLKHIRIPDFDIATQTDLVDGIHSSLEPSRCNSSSSGSNSVDSRQEGYSGHHDQSHDSCSESDEAESSFNELEFESPPSNASYGASNIFKFDGEGFPQESLGDDNLSKLCAYFELEGQTHGENGHKGEHHGKSIFLESISSPCGSITGNDNHDILITLESDSCSSCVKLQTEESAFPYSIDEEQGLQPLGWSRFGKQVWNSDIDCFQRCFLSCAKSPYEVEAQTGGRENHSYVASVPENCLQMSSTSDTHISTADANEEIFKAFVVGISEKLSCTKPCQDEDATVDIVSAVKTEAYGKIVGCQMHKTDSTLIGAQSELKAENLDTENECEMIQEVDGQDNSSCHNPCEANRDFLVELGSIPFENNFGKNKPNKHMECENISGSSRESSSDLIGLGTNYEHPMSVPTADDSCAQTCSGESSEQTLLVEERIGHSHSSVLTGMFSIHDTSYVCLQHMEKSILDTSYQTSMQMGNDIAGRTCVNKLDPYYRNEIWGLGTGGAEMTKNSEVPCSHYSNDLHMECMGTYNAFEVTSDRSYVSGTVSTFEFAHCFNSADTSAPADFGDDCTRTRANWPCSNPGILAEGKGDISTETNSEVGYQVLHLIGDVGTSTNHTVPDATDEGKKDMEECEENPLTTMAISGKSREGMVAEIRSPGNKVLKSVAGSITLIGALLIFLRVRSMREKEKNSHTVVPLQSKVEIGKSNNKYPGDKLKL